jgi:DNA-binding MarR family transcriptional regulator
VIEGKARLEVAAQLHSGAIHLLRALRPIDRKSGLTPARLSALSVLVFAGPCMIGELARAEGVAGPTMTRIVDGLAALGLAQRTPDLADGRSIRVGATETGIRVMKQARQHRLQAIAAAVEGLPAADRRRIALAAPMLDRVAAAVSGQQAPSRPDVDSGQVREE